MGVLLLKKSIKTLVDDIKNLFNSPQEIPPDLVDDLGRDLANTVRDRMSAERGASYLRLSNLGSVCAKKLWFSVNAPELGEPLRPETKLKFLYGDILEHLVLFLARLAGHDVRDQQKEVNLHGVSGHLDARIDDHLVDAKSASSFSYKKFEKGLKKEDDAFGYIPQLSGYMEEEGDEEGSFLVIDKVHGNICLDTHKKAKIDFEKLVNERKEMLSKNAPPERAFTDVPDGKSGNRKLGVECSYCEFKNACWPGLRTFLYSYGPVFLTKVEREPNVPEAK